MKKVVKLKESDLQRIIKRTIKNTRLLYTIGYYTKIN